MEVLIAVGLFAIAIALLSLGSVFLNRPLKGSCGGLAGAMGKDGDGHCSTCGRSVSDCPNK
jgi:hypothetical protein